jgi:hypothetical protein
MIHYNVPEPKLSPDFTIEDIHKIRDWNYERLKDATREERIADTRRRAESYFRRANLPQPKHIITSTAKPNPENHITINTK